MEGLGYVVVIDSRAGRGAEVASLCNPLLAGARVEVTASYLTSSHLGAASVARDGWEGSAWGGAWATCSASMQRLSSPQAASSSSLAKEEAPASVTGKAGEVGEERAQPAAASSALAMQAAPTRDGDEGVDGSAVRLVAGRREDVRLAQVETLVKELHLGGPLGKVSGDLWVQGTPSTRELSQLAELRGRLRKLVQQTWDLGRMLTALGAFKAFLGATGRVPFVPVRACGDLEALGYNQETLDLFAAWLHQRGKLKRGRAGEALASDTIATYVSAIKTLRGAEARQRITCPEVNVTLPVALKRMRQEVRQRGRGGREGMGQGA